jgi:hypothetical protein
MSEREVFLRELEEMESPSYINKIVKTFNVEIKQKIKLIDKKFEQNPYVVFKVGVDVEGSVKVKPLNDSSSLTVSLGGATKTGDNAKNYLLATLKKELSDGIELKGEIEVGKEVKVEMKIKHFNVGRVNFSSNFNWTGFYSFKIEVPFSGKMQISDIIVEGKLKLTVTLSVGPNWKKIAIYQVIKQGWKPLGKALVTGLWTTTAGTATTLKVISSTVGLVAVAVGVPYYLLYRTFTSLYAGHIEGLGSAYAGGYTTHLFYNLTGEDKPRYSIYFGSYSKLGMTKRTDEEAEKIVSKLGSDKNLIVKYMASTLKAVAQVGNYQLKPEFSQNMRALGAAHAQLDLLKFRSNIRRLYGIYNPKTGKFDASNESAELWRLIAKFTLLNKTKFRQKVNEHIAEQFKSKMGKEKEPVEGYPLDLYDMMNARII